MGKWLMWAVVLAVLGGLARSMVQSHADTKMEEYVEATRAKLPMDVAGGLRLTAVDYTDRTLRLSGRFTALHAVDPAQRQFAQANLHEQYCNGPMKVLHDNGIRVQYEVQSQAFGEPEDTTRLSAAPEDCP